ncbi:hypothetical protein Tco_0969830 [Tanacetum coccineum]
MGYEGDLNTLTFNKGLFSPQWKFLFHTIIHCLSSKSTSWDQIPTNIATAVICLATNQVYNFSKLIFDGMMRHLDAKKKFVMYPRFLPVFLTNQLKNVPVPLDHFPINALTTKVFSFMVKKGKKISGNVTPLFPSMLAQPTEDEGAVSERPSETQPTPSPTHPSEDQSEPQPDPFLRPSSSNPIPDSIPEGSGGNHGGQSSSDRSLSRNEDGLTLQSVYDLCVNRMLKMRGGQALKHWSLACLEILWCLKRRKVKKRVSTEDPVSTAQPKVSTDKPKLVLTSQKLAPTRMMKVEFKRISFVAALAVSRSGSVSKQTTRSHHRVFQLTQVLIHIESRRSATKSCLMLAQEGFSIFPM